MFNRTTMGVGKAFIVFVYNIEKVQQQKRSSMAKSQFQEKESLQGLADVVVNAYPAHVIDYTSSLSDSDKAILKANLGIPFLCKCKCSDSETSLSNATVIGEIVCIGPNSNGRYVFHVRRGIADVSGMFA